MLATKTNIYKNIYFPIYSSNNNKIYRLNQSVSIRDFLHLNVDGSHNIVRTHNFETKTAIYWILVYRPIYLQGLLLKMLLHDVDWWKQFLETNLM